MHEWYKLRVLDALPFVSSGWGEDDRDNLGRRLIDTLASAFAGRDVLHGTKEPKTFHRQDHELPEFDAQTRSHWHDERFIKIDATQVKGILLLREMITRYARVSYLDGIRRGMNVLERLAAGEVTVDDFESWKSEQEAHLRQAEADAPFAKEWRKKLERDPVVPKPKKGNSIRVLLDDGE